MIRKGAKICSCCNGSERTTEDFKKMIEKINPDIEIIGEYIGARKAIRCRCKIDGYEWEPLVYNLLSGCGCPECANRNAGDAVRISKEERLRKLQEMHPDIEFLSIPDTSKGYVECRCKKCGCVWWATYINLTKTTRPTGCPKCINSKGERVISKCLEEWGYQYKCQYTFQDCRDSNVLPFDFYLIDYNTVIEFDGEHHFYPIIRTNGDDKEEVAKEIFEKIVRHDQIKNEYCKTNNISIIRIPYWYRNDLEVKLFDELFKIGIIIKE